MKYTIIGDYGACEGPVYIPIVLPDDWSKQDIKTMMDIIDELQHRSFSRVNIAIDLSEEKQVACEYCLHGEGYGDFGVTPCLHPGKGYECTHGSCSCTESFHQVRYRLDKEQMARERSLND